MTCPKCSGSYFHTCNICPWCDASRPGFIMAAVLLWYPQRLRRSSGGELDTAPGIVREPSRKARIVCEPSGKARIVDALVISANQPVELTERITHGTSGSTPKLRVEFVGNRLTLEPLDEEQWRLTPFDGRRERQIKKSVTLAIKGDGSESVRGQCMVHTGSAGRLHRVIRFDLRQGRFL